MDDVAFAIIPAIGFEVLGVNVRALGDGSGSLADGTSVFVDVLVLGQVFHGDFVPKGDIVDDVDFADVFSFEGDNAHGGTFGDIHHGHADIIGKLV